MDKENSGKIRLFLHPLLSFGLPIYFFKVQKHVTSGANEQAFVV
jgi:hypothetical protein